MMAITHLTVTINNLTSLPCRHNLTSISNICIAVPISLLWVLTGLNESLEEHFEFPFTLIGKSTTLSLTGQSRPVLKSD